MITTTYQCDRCGAISVGQDEHDLKAITIGICSAMTYHYSLSDFSNRTAYWCRKCRVEVGIEHPNRAKDVTPIAPSPTLEELIREMVREEIEASHE